MRLIGRFFVLVAIVSFSASCFDSLEITQKNDIDQRFFAYLPENFGTKVAVSENMVFWEESDAITIFRSTTNEKYQYSGISGNVDCLFKKADSSVPGERYSRNYAIFPYSQYSLSVDEGELLVDVPTVQCYQRNSFGKEANIMAAVSQSPNDTRLYFSNLCGYLIVKIYGGEIIQQITLYGNCNEKISGQGLISFNAKDEPILITDEFDGESISIDCGKEGVLTGSSKAGYVKFWIVVPPTTFEKGISIDVHKTDGSVFTKKTNQKIEIKTNTVKTMSAFSTTDEIASDGRVIPADEPSINTWKQAHQFRLIKWNALGSIPSGASSPSGIGTGIHTGLPYSSCMEVDKFVGFDVSLKTFMTCVNNPYSLIYTEDLKRNTSEYGQNYHNTGKRGTIAGYMGVVCNVFALYSIGAQIPYDTHSWSWCAKKGIMEIPENQTHNGVKVGDLIWEPGHARVVTALYKNSSGEISHVQVEESVMNYPISTKYTSDQFDNFIANGKIIYRYCDFDKNKHYYPSPFVGVDEEVPAGYAYNDDICTFAGDYACFRMGQTIYINYNLKSKGAWTTLCLYCNDELIGQYSIDTESHRFDLSGMNLDCGMYKACLSDGKKTSDYTYFEIIDTAVSWIQSGDESTIYFASHQGRPLYIAWCMIDGGPLAKYPLSEVDILNGYSVIDAKELISEQDKTYINGGTYCKVIFAGEYGRVSSEPKLF